MSREQLLKMEAAIESKTGGCLYVDFELDKPQDRECWYDLTQLRNPLRWFAFVLPEDVPSLLPIKRNQPNATFWIEGAEREEVYLRLAAAVSGRQRFALPMTPGTTAVILAKQLCKKT